MDAWHCEICDVRVVRGHVCPMSGSDRVAMAVRRSVEGDGARIAMRDPSGKATGYITCTTKPLPISDCCKDHEDKVVAAIVAWLRDPRRSERPRPATLAKSIEQGTWRRHEVEAT